ncbi:ATP-dependent (S)-NAD(P)H-hydrate dehydratase [Paramicrosporidium saccamoebae]|uniref:ATP-dependent (S)-NAD(P)H-hydrate dehydratase n=1 Tax=Paramicrosporidium saccamoebae TaxID=1246581 RepID=A0A2H9TJ83_9FUNG|nr:ATP-dependent (S)-NAD(P)H-hydrate dehydratase [Paramicrosporidium saccamoebae]
MSGILAPGVLGDLDLGRKPENDWDLRRDLHNLTKKADTCDRLLESLVGERQRFEPSKNSSGDLVSTLNSLRDGQRQLIQVVDKLRSELTEERRSKELLISEVRNMSNSWAGSQKALSPMTNALSPGASESDLKYKELKKKLLMANLKILELQNRKNDKIAVVGGSLEYTGAPYFAAMAALRTVTPSAISQHLGRRLGFLYPLLPCSKSAFAEIDPSAIERIFARINVDALFMLSLCKEKVPTGPLTILTPNHREMAMLCNAFELDESSPDACLLLSKAAQGSLVFSKGAKDCLQCESPSVPRRCGGQGDILTGILATFWHWFNINLAGSKNKDKSLLEVAADCSNLLRMVAQLGYGEHGRGTIATDFIDQIPRAVRQFEPTL